MKFPDFPANETNPITIFSEWFEAAKNLGMREYTSMVLATVDSSGQPSSRVVLLKDFNQAGFVFYTNYDSRKGIELRKNPKCALLFYWDSAARQVRMRGEAKPLSANESDEYFASRPYESQLGAWASQQSRVVENRAELEQSLEKFRTNFGSTVPRPENWGGFRFIPKDIEFWINGANRLHDRFLFSKKESGWSKVRLSP